MPGIAGPCSETPKMVRLWRCASAIISLSVQKAWPETRVWVWTSSRMSIIIYIYMCICGRVGEWYGR